MKKVDGILSTLSTRLFTYDKDTKTFSTEMSDLPRSFNVVRIWDDACDQGFWLESHVTGQKKLFSISDRKVDNEGDLMYFEFTCIEPGLGDVKITMFND